MIRQLSESSAARLAVHPCKGASGRCGSAHDAGGRLRVDGDKMRSPAHWFCKVREGGSGRTGTRRFTAVAKRAQNRFTGVKPPADWLDPAAPQRVQAPAPQHICSHPAPCLLSPEAPLQQLRESSAAWPSDFPRKGERELCFRAHDAGVWVPRAVTKVEGEPRSQVLHRQPGAAATARLWWSSPRISTQVAAAAGRYGAHLLRGRRGRDFKKVSRTGKIRCQIIGNIPGRSF
jgi:hypothetical protein